MNIEIFTVCDSAQTYGDRLVIMGAYNNLTVASLPYIIPSLAIVGKIGFDKGERGKYDFKVRLVQERGGKDVLSLPVSTIDVSQTKGDNAYFNLIMNIGNLVIKEAGDYIITLESGNVVKETRIHVSMAGGAKNFQGSRN